MMIKAVILKASDKISMEKELILEVQRKFISLNNCLLWRLLNCIRFSLFIIKFKLLTAILIILTKLRRSYGYSDQTM
jgi:hypothetical protein